MSAPDGARSIRVVPGEISSGTVTVRLGLPTSTLPAWPPFRRLAEGIASRGRRLPPHAHEREDVLTFIVEGFASYQLEDGPVASLPQGAARLLTAVRRTTHRVDPAEGAAIRWFNLVVDLPPSYVGRDDLQSVGPETSSLEIDNVRVRKLVGPRGPMRSGAGLICEALTFPDASTTFRRVGAGSRALLYVSAGAGAVDEQPIAAGESAFLEGVPGVSVRGTPGFQAVWATAPVDVP